MEGAGGRIREYGEGDRVVEEGEEERGEERGGAGEEGRERWRREGKREKGEGKKGAGKEKTWKVAFWNVAGVGNKDREFWEGIGEWDIVIMTETWMDERGWERIKERVPKEFKWSVQTAKRRNRKGRACGGMLMGIREGLIVEEEGRETVEEGRMKCMIRVGDVKWRIVGLYINGDMERKLEGLKDWMEEREEDIRTLIGGDFNARTGEEGGWIEEEEQGDEERKRKSKDKKVNKEGKRLIDFIERRGWVILNGNIKGDEEGEYTYTGGRGETVIDYIIGDREGMEKIERVEVGERMDSDHHPIVAWIRGRVKRERREEGGRRAGGRGIWNEEGRIEFREKIGNLEGGEGGVQEEIGKVTEKIRKTIDECEEGKRKDGRKKRGWWDQECRIKKGEVRRELRKWRGGRADKDSYRRQKKEYKEMCENKKREERDRLVREAGEARTEGKVWELVSRERKRRKKINEKIKMEEWKEYFMGLMGGVEGRVIKGGREENRREGQEEAEIEWEEVKRVSKRLRDGKAMGTDGVPSEVWKYGGEEVERWIWRVCNRIWRGEGWPEQWKEGVIVPILKKGEGNRVENYRGVTLMPSLYKIYTTIIAERLREEVEGKGLLPKSQAGFRRGMGTIDQIYALNYMINRQLGEGKRKMVALFIDLKAAFDSVDRATLIGAMRERGVREGLVERVEEVIRETRSKVRIGIQEGEGFWTARGVRQGCPLSPMLFNLIIADLEEYMERGRWGGLKLRQGKIFTLMYADDIVLLAEEEQGMRAMISRLEGYLDKKGLELNVEKTKIMRFRRGGGRKKKIDWRFKGKKIEEIGEFKYLGYTVKGNGGQEAHVKERRKRAAIVMREIWGIGKRIWGRDWERRLWLYDTLVWTVMGYGAEVWGWRERGEVEGVHDRFVRWTMGVDWRTPGYMLREEVGRGMMRGRAGRRAFEYERRLEEGRGGEVARDCWEEMKERWRKGKVIGRWEQERREFFRERGVNEGEEESVEYEELDSRDRQRQRRETWGRIRESRYNKWYKEIKKEGVPKYLKKGWAEGRWRRIIRYRLGNEVNEGLYWEGEDKRKCRICEGEEETWEHVWGGCVRGERWEGGTWQEMVGKILGEEGEGEEWMQELEVARGVRERGEEGERGRQERG